MSLGPGQRLGQYEIVAPLGAGGMGEVFRAKDARLGREVALKLLPTAFATDADRLARFEREAKVLASLNHPGIAHLYGFETATLADGSAVHFLAMELVPGEELAARIDRGPIPLDEALPIARQVAEALEEAHEKGIVHRDLKPANVKLTPDGKVKVLDFGLAKAWSGDDGLFSGSSARVSQSPTLARTGTEAGLILGTAAYMSPEQARGRAVDKRSDVWAFGVVLFEMLTGRKLFAGDTVTDVLAAVVRQEIDWSQLPAATPDSVRELLRRALDRDAKTRLRDIGEARVALSATDTAATRPEAPARPPLPAGRLAAAALLLAALAFAVGYALHRPAAPTLLKLDITDQGLTTSDMHAPVLSPDGRRVAYFARKRLHVRELDRADARELPETENARDAFWSPDGREVGFHRGDALYRLALAGGAPILITQSGGHVSGSGACWLPDGQVVFSRGNTPLIAVPVRGGEQRVLVEPDRAAGQIHLHACTALPDGRGLLYAAHPGDGPANTIAVSAAGRTRPILTLPNETVAHAAYADSGHVVFSRTGSGRDGIWALPFSLERLEATGEPFPIAPGGVAPSVARDGSLLYVANRGSGRGRLVWVGRDGGVQGAAAETPGRVSLPALSADGARVAVILDEAQRSLWLFDLKRGTRTRLAADMGTIGKPVFSRDGSRLAFAAGNQVYVLPADGGGTPRKLGPGLAPTFSRDASTVVAHVSNDEGGFELRRLDALGDRPPELLLRDASALRWPDISPDGRFLAYHRDAAGAANVWLTRFPELEGRWQVSTEGGDFGAWSPDSRRYYYLKLASDGSRVLTEVDVQTTPAVSLGRPRPLFDLEQRHFGNVYCVATDGRFLMVEQDAADSAARLVLVRNWFEEFRGGR